MTLYLPQVPHELVWVSA